MVPPQIRTPAQVNLDVEGHQKLAAQINEVVQKLYDADVSVRPTQEELRAVYTATFEEMSDPWEITANGDCKVFERKNKA